MVPLAAVPLAAASLAVVQTEVGPRGRAGERRTSSDYSPRPSSSKTTKHVGLTWKEDAWRYVGASSTRRGSGCWDLVTITPTGVVAEKVRLLVISFW